MARHGFEIIPVIDIRHGQAVRAVAGDRARYRALETPLADGSQPADVTRGYWGLFPFRAFYVADLDGIEGRGSDLGVVRSIAAVAPGSEVWVDNGAATEACIAELLSIDAASAVIGSETAAGSAEVERLVSRYGERILLSLDFRGDVFQGPANLLQASSCWPSRVIVMTLARVGGGEGPDFARLLEIKERAERSGRDVRVYAAGGVRNRDDLSRLKEMGLAGALVATALHGGQIKTGDLREVAGE